MYTKLYKSSLWYDKAHRYWTIRLLKVPQLRKNFSNKRLLPEGTLCRLLFQNEQFILSFLLFYTLFTPNSSMIFPTIHREEIKC